MATKTARVLAREALAERLGVSERTVRRLEARGARPADLGYGPALLTAEEVARSLRISVSTLREWRRAGLLPRPVELGNRSLRWSSQAITNALMRGYRTGAGAAGELERRYQQACDRDYQRRLDERLNGPITQRGGRKR